MPQPARRNQPFSKGAPAFGRGSKAKESKANGSRNSVLKATRNKKLLTFHKDQIIKETKKFKVFQLALVGPGSALGRPSSK